MLKNLSKPMQMALIAVLAAAAYFLLSPILFPAPPAVAKKTMTTTKSTAKTIDIYLPEDTTAHFQPVALAVKDSFKPLIAPVVAAGKAGVSQVNLVPPEFAGGESNWAYTGSSQIDGVFQALLENKTSGDNVFLKVGDTWKGISVEVISEDSLTLASPDTGTEKKLTIPPDVVTPGPAGFAPAGPLRGNIGAMGLQPDPSMMQGQDPNGLPNFGALPNSYGNGNGNGGNGNGGNGRNRGGGGNGRGRGRGNNGGGNGGFGGG